MTTRSRFTAVLLLLVLVLLAQSLALSPASRLAPLWALLPTAVLLLVQLVVELSPRLGERLAILRESGVVPVPGGPPAYAEPPDDSAPPEDRRKREARVVFWIAWLIVLMYLVGFLLSTVLFLLPFLRKESGLGWGRTVVLTAVAAGVVYVAFGVVARVPFPPGILF